jgi:hypothetical protein
MPAFALERDSSVSIVTRLQNGQPMGRGSFPAREKRFTSPKHPDRLLAPALPPSLLVTGYWGVRTGVVRLPHSPAHPGLGVRGTISTPAFTFVTCTGQLNISPSLSA